MNKILERVYQEDLSIKPTSVFFNRIVKACRAFIPQKIPNVTVLNALRILSILPVPMIGVAMNHLYNTRILCGQDRGGSPDFYDADGYIENQNEWKKVNFGFFYHMNYSGCEIIAVYNALRALGEKVSAQTMADLISMFERRGAVLGGLFGTSPHAIKAFLVRSGYEVSMTVDKDAETVIKIGESSDTVIVTAYNNEKNIMAQVHTVSITKEKGETYSIHNAYHRVNGKYAAKEGYRTLQDAVHAMSNSAPASISVIGISRTQLEKLT